MTDILEILLDGLLDTVKLLPFLFVTYLLMELLEHKAGDRVEAVISRSGRGGPLAGALLGLLPQCGFSVMAAGFYMGGVVSTGTLLAVFLSTSDEMLAIFIGGGVPWPTVLKILGLKFFVAAVTGFATDLLLRRSRKELCVSDLCDAEGCHCEDGVWRSALHHTLHVSLFVLVINLALGVLLYFVQVEALVLALRRVPLLLQPVAALVGLVPNCAASVAITTLYLEGVLTPGATLAGLLTGAGAGLAVLFRLEKNRKRLLCLVLALLAIGTTVGLLVDLTGLAALLGV
jgi:hypothetical protein